MAKLLELTEVLDIVDRVDFPEYEFNVEQVGELFLMSVTYAEPDVFSGVAETQQGRRWVIERDSVETQIVQTCFLAVKQSLEHRLREHFTYKGQVVLNPHFDMEELLKISHHRKYDAGGINFESVGPRGVQPAESVDPQDLDREDYCSFCYHKVRKHLAGGCGKKRHIDGKILLCGCEYTQQELYKASQYERTKWRDPQWKPVAEATAAPDEKNG